MLIGDRIREIRKAKGLSQGDVEKRTGLLRSYISRIENNFTTPSLETLNRFAYGLQIPLYAFFGQIDPKPRPEGNERSRQDAKRNPWSEKILALLPRMSERDRNVLMKTAVRMAQRKKRKSSES